MLALYESHFKIYTNILLGNFKQCNVEHRTVLSGFLPSCVLQRSNASNPYEMPPDTTAVHRRSQGGQASQISSMSCHIVLLRGGISLNSCGTPTRFCKKKLN